MIEIPTEPKADAELFAKEYQELCMKYKLQIISRLELQVIKDEPHT